MAHLQFTRHLLRFFPDLTEGQVEGATVAEVFTNLEKTYPGIRDYLLDGGGSLRRHVNVFVNQELIGDRQTLSDSVDETSSIHIIQALSGG